MVCTVDIVTVQVCSGTFFAEVFEDIESSAQHHDVGVVVAQAQDPERNDVAPLLLNGGCHAHRDVWCNGCRG